jgi:hypothetical protein
MLEHHLALLILLLTVSTCNNSKGTISNHIKSILDMLKILVTLNTMHNTSNTTLNSRLKLRQQQLREVVTHKRLLLPTEMWEIMILAMHHRLLVVALVLLRRRLVLIHVTLNNRLHRPLELIHDMQWGTQL